MTEVAAHPSTSASDRDSAVLRYAFRLKVCDVVDGAGLENALAVKPEVVDGPVAGAASKTQVSVDVLRSRGEHPFRVVTDSTARFYVHDSVGQNVYRGFQYPVKSLRTCTLSPPAADGSRTPTWLWHRVPEFFRGLTGQNEVQSGSLTFVRVDDSTRERYALTRSSASATVYARRDLITDENGVLDIPLTFAEWNDGVTIVIKLRDYKILEAMSPFEPELDPAELGLTLEGDPAANEWKATALSFTGAFQDEIEFEVEPRQAPAVRDPDTSRLVHAAVWAVRRVSEYDGDFKTRTNVNRSRATPTPEGIVIHYNSGVRIHEYRGKARDFATTRNSLRGVTKKLCREAFAEGENEFAFEVRTALGILYSIYGNGTRRTSVGYHYHLDRAGGIVLVVPEERRANHAGSSRELAEVPAAEPDGIRENVYTAPVPVPLRESLDRMYIGIDLLGCNTNRRIGTDARHHFTSAQHFYLDRLIENIMSRRAELDWTRLLGHDEVRAAYNSVRSAANRKPSKLDPGDALHRGGMEGLRWRHGGDEGREDTAGVDYLVFDGRRLAWFDAGGALLRFWPAVSGRPGYQAPEHQDLEDKGPIPSGKYHVCQSEYQEADTWDQAVGLVGRGAWPGSTFAWGVRRVWIHPANAEASRFPRSGFSIHGGSEPGSAGCVDLTSEMKSFADRFREHARDMILLVRYD